MTSDPPRPRLDARRANERPHVLVVSDDPSLSGFLQEGLPLGGFWVSVIAGGLQALEVFRLRQFDLIALDAGLQSFDAIEFLRRLRGVSTRDRSGTERSRAPVIVIHPASEPGTEFDANELDVAAQLVPPIELEDIVVTLHAVFAAWRSDHPDSPLADAASARAF
jgi:DNA-binding response OmpR family regulator